MCRGQPGSVPGLPAGGELAGGRHRGGKWITGRRTRRRARPPLSMARDRTCPGRASPAKAEGKSRGHPCPPTAIPPSGSPRHGCPRQRTPLTLSSSTVSARPTRTAGHHTEGRITMTDHSTTRIALVTGGSGGIGRAVVERLAKDGIAVGVHYGRQQGPRRGNGRRGHRGGRPGDRGRRRHRRRARHGVGIRRRGVGVRRHRRRRQHGGRHAPVPDRHAGPERPGPDAPHQHPRHLRGLPAGGPASAARRVRPGECGPAGAARRVRSSTSRPRSPARSSPPTAPTRPARAPSRP